MLLLGGDRSLTSQISSDFVRRRTSQLAQCLDIWDQVQLTCLIQGYPSFEGTRALRGRELLALVVDPASVFRCPMTNNGLRQVLAQELA